MKLGMKRLRGGGIGRVAYIQPKEFSEYPVLLEYSEKGSEIFHAWRSLLGAAPHEDLAHCEIVEHLCDELHDPRIWMPPPVYREGLWRCADGSIELFAGEDPERHTTIIGYDDGKIYVGSNDKWSIRLALKNPPVEYVGPIPVKGMVEGDVR